MTRTVTAALGRRDADLDAIASLLAGSAWRHWRARLLISWSPSLISLPAGIAGTKPVRFGIYSTVGCIPWTAALAYAVGQAGTPSSTAPG
jgi:uncharacterized membrane protein YdjX (TVP38/TMEM64 family)